MVLYDFTASSSSAMAPTGSCSATAPWPATSSRWLSATSLPVCAGVPAGLQFCHGAPASSSFPMAHCHVPASLHWCPGRSAVPPRCPLAAAPLRRPGQQQLCYGAPASNKLHPSERSTPVWLAIWHIWAGFANSQLLHAAFCSIYLYSCAHSPSYHIELLLRQTQICRPICTDCLRHLRISAE